MAQPTIYNRLASFSNLQALSPDDPPPGNTLDAEFNAIKQTLDEICANIALIQRDDGEVADGSIGRDQLAPEVDVGFNAPSVWVTATDYVASEDTVFHGSGFYRCLVDHTAGTFATDLAAGKWELIVDLSGIALVAANQIAVTPTGGIASTDVQAALAELDSEKAAVSHTHPASAISDSTADGRAMLTAASVVAQRALLGLGALALLNEVEVDEITANLALSGIIEPSALAANTDDWAPTGDAASSTIRVSASSAVNLTGIEAPAVDGTVKILENVGSFAITLKANSTSSTAGNRFKFARDIVLQPNESVFLKYDLDGSAPDWRLIASQPGLPRSYLSGFALANGTDATNDINIAAGTCRDKNNQVDLVIGAMTKQLDAVWAAGTNQGMRHSGTAIANGTWHLFAIGKGDGANDDYFAYTGVDPSAVLPSGYLYYRRIGSILREAASIVGFVQDGDYFQRKAWSDDVSSTNPGTSAVTNTLKVPLGINVIADIAGHLDSSAAASGSRCFFSDPAVTNEATTDAHAHLGTVASGRDAGQFLIRTNTSAQIKSRLDSSTASTVLNIATRGWIDRRGRDD